MAGEVVEAASVPTVATTGTGVAGTDVATAEDASVADWGWEGADAAVRAGLSSRDLGVELGVLVGVAVA